MHDGQLAVPLDVVVALVADQFPAWAGLPVAPVRGEGSVHAVFRVGDQLAARFPLQGDAPAVVGRRLAAEAAAARELVGRTRFPVPEPVALGSPGAGYPLPWAVQTWVPGTTATNDDPGSSVPFADDLVAFVADVRSIDTRGRTFAGTGRGGDLRAHDAWVEHCLDRSGDLVDEPATRSLWRRLRDLPRPPTDVMTHGDLVPGNVLVRGGRLVGVLDTGGAGAADRALDLVAAWHLLDDRPRAFFRAGLGCTGLEWARGAAWALEQALGLGWYYRDSNPAMSRTGVRTIRRLLAASELQPSLQV